MEDEFLEKYLKSKENKIPECIAEIIKKCLKKKPEERYNSMKEVVEELKKAYYKITGRKLSCHSFP